MSFSVEQSGQTFRVYLDGRLFTSCVYEPEYVRPFMGPVFASDFKQFTRFEPHHAEHPHQRSVFVGVGDVNGVDCWNEKGEGKGKMTLDSVLDVRGGDTAVISVRLVWSAIDDGRKLVDEVRTIRFEKKTDCVAVYITLTFFATYGDVTFGQTTEAGPLGIRVADALRADRGGVFTNSEGGVNEDACWGKTAKWCNYSGSVNGKTLGIACYDRPSNAQYPTAWHIRNYGLMAPNNLLFKSTVQIPQRQSVRYDYLLCFWEDTFDPKKYEE